MARTEQQMEEELKGMAAPAEDMPMAEEEAPMAEESSTLTASTMASNFNSMDPELQDAIKPLFSGDGLTAMSQLLGEAIVSDFTSQIDMAPAEEAPATPAPQGEGMMAPEAPMPAMAKGGMINTQLRDMKAKGMSPQEIRSQIK